MGFIFGLILFQVLIFAGLAFALRHFLTKNVTSATDHLQTMIRDNAAKQDEIKKKLEEAEQKYKDAIKKTEKEIVEMKEKCQKDIDTERDKILTQAHQQSEDLLERARKSVQAMNENMEQAILQKAAERAGVLACEVLPDGACKSIHGEWIDALISNGLSSTQENLRVPDGVNSVKVMTAYALSEAERNKLSAALRERVGREVLIEEEINAELIAGIVVSIGPLVLDGSFRNKVQELIRKAHHG